MKTKLIILAIILSLFTIFLIGKQSKKQSRSIVTKAASPVAAPLPTEIPVYEPETKVLESPEGSKILNLERKTDKESILYSLNVTSVADNQKTEIMTDSKDFRNLEIPFNAWSPDNVYFFLKEKTLTFTDYLVFKSSGEPLSENKKYISIGELFKQKLSEFAIEDVTGWGGINLILINVKNTASNQKVSFWFDVPTQNFIQLTAYFK